MTTKKKPGRPRKTEPKAEAPALTAKDIVNVAKTMTDEDRKLLAEALGIEPAQPINVDQRREVGQRRTVEASVEKEIATPPPKPAPKPGVIFKSPHLGLWQILKKSWKERLGDDDSIIHPPRIAEFYNGTWRTSDEEEIELMRAKIQKKRDRGGQVEVIEVRDERVKEALDVGGPAKAIENKNGVTVDTPLAELVR